MKLITPLACGVDGAENGVARIYVRGTSTRATYYTDFEGLAPISSGADVTLDSRGGAIVYVNSMVTVDVVGTNGSTIRSFVAGEASGSVEVRSQSFTGTSYDDGSGTTTTGISQPTTLQAVLDLWQTNNLSEDWKVGVGGTERTISSWLSSIAGMFYNVKDVIYGAQGNGSADDSAAIQAACTAAQNAGGGIVFFPPGTYRITQAITVGTKVSVWATGGNASTLRIDHASANGLVVAGATSSYERFQEIRGLRIDAQQAHTGNMIRTTNALLKISDCTIGDGTNANGRLIEADSGLTTSDLRIDNCQFKVGATGAAFYNTATGLRAKISNCSFIPPATYNGTYITSCGMHLTDNYFRNGTATAGTIVCISFETGADSVSTANEFDNGGGSTVSAMRFNTLGAGIFVREDNNHIGSSVTRYTFVAATDSQHVVLGSRVLDHAQINSNATPLALSTTQFGSIQVHVTTAGARTITAEGNVPLGAPLKITLWNDSTGGTVTWTMTTNFVPDGTIVVNDNCQATIVFQGILRASGSVAWYQISESALNLAE